MKLLPAFLFSLVGVAAASLLYVQPPSKGRPSMPAAPEGDADNPNARSQWELAMLRDPATGEIPYDIRHRELAYAVTLPTAEANAFMKGAGAATTWTSRGPGNVGGRTRALAVDVSDQNVLLAGGVTSGIWRSSDKGASWHRTSLATQSSIVTCLAQDTRAGKQDTWYYGTGEFRNNIQRFGNVIVPGDGIYKSADGGITWSQLASTASNTPQMLDNQFEYVRAIAIDPSNAAQDEVYAAAYGGIMRSTDGGESWTSVLGGINNPTGYTDVAVTSSGVVYAALGSGGPTRGIWRSTDGLQWENITPSGFGDSCRGIVIALSPSDENRLYVLGETQGKGLQVAGSYGFNEFYSLWSYNYISGNGTGSGGSWENRSLNLPQLGGAWTTNCLTSYCMMLEVDPLDKNTLYFGGTNLYRSRDGFATTTMTDWIGGYGQDQVWGDTGMLHPDQHTLVFDPHDPHRAYSGNDGGVYTLDVTSTNPGFAWTPLNNGYVSTQFYTVAIDHAPGGQMVMGGAQDNGTFHTISTDPTAPWAWPAGGDGSFCAIEDGARRAYVSAQFATIYQIDLDSAGNVTTYKPIRPTGVGGFQFINAFALDPADNELLYLPAGTSLWRNDKLSAFDPGTPNANWLRIAVAQTFAPITAVGVSKSNPAHRVYMGTGNGRVYRVDSADGSSPSTKDITGSAFPAGYINCVAVDPNDADRAMVVFSNYNVQSLFYTTDGGSTWTQVGGNLEQNTDGTGNGPSCRWAAVVHHGSQTTWLVATSTGLYSTSQLNGSATTWEQEGVSTIGTSIVSMIDVRQSDGLVAVGTWGNGIFTATYGLSGIETERKDVRALLEEPTPNLVRDRTTIAFTVPEGAPSRTRVRIFDALGGTVATLVDEPLDAGRHTRSFDIDKLTGVRLPSGGYYVHLEVDGVTETRRLMVSR